MPFEHDADHGELRENGGVAGLSLGSRLVSDDKPKWDMPTNVVSSKLDQAGELAKKHGIPPDRAQMLIDRYGDDQEQLDKAAKGARINPK